jgi:predicted permease
MLLFWPFVVVGMGLFVGYLVAKLAKTPKCHTRACLVACAFGNSSGLPITLLTVVHTNFPVTSDLGRIDPTLFLSIYLLLYPVLQWGLGAWLVSPNNDDDDDDDNGISNGHSLLLQKKDRMSNSTSPRNSQLRNNHGMAASPIRTTTHNNNNGFSHVTDTARTTILSNDEGNYISEVDLLALAREEEDDDNFDNFEPILALPLEPTMSDHPLEMEADGYYSTDNVFEERLLPLSPEPAMSHSTTYTESDALLVDKKKESHTDISIVPSRLDSAWSLFLDILQRTLQPPVIGSLAGIFVATIEPLRGVFVDLETRSSRAALQWFFDGLYTIGLTAVPINMIILGCNISASRNSEALWWKSDDRLQAGFLPWKTMVWIVIGKMVILPLLGISLCFFLKKYVLNLPEDIDGAVYLVLMIVFLTPTANNVMLMVELGGSPGVKEGMAQVLALQYAIAPIVLSVTMSIAIGVASDWS